ncbi:MAG: HepT-like ribonuclease domain-containing protein [Sulfurimonas sp.]|jgi:uncharacterized protein with HEPN domain
MSDSNLMVLSTLEDIKYSLELILKRFKHINSSDDFMDNEDNLEKLDSIAMRLVAIGEGFKNIDKLTQKNFLINYESIDWKGVKGIRDVLSHHYFDINAEVIYDLCDKNLGELLSVVILMIEDIKSTHSKEKVI